MVFQVRRNLLPSPAWARTALGCTSISLRLLLGPQAQQDSNADVLAAAKGQNSTVGMSGRSACKAIAHSLATALPEQRVLQTGDSWLSSSPCFNAYLEDSTDLPSCSVSVVTFDGLVLLLHFQWPGLSRVRPWHPKASVHQP